MKWPIVFAGALLCFVLTMSLCSTEPSRAIDSRLKNTRDSVETLWVEKTAKHDTFRIWLRTASADTLGAILRDRARRPPVFIHDTIFDDSMTTTEDGRSSQLCEVAISCFEARSLLLRDSALILLSDSLRGAIVVQGAEKDSAIASCHREKPNSSTWLSAGIGFATGYSAGLATCIVLK